MLSSTTSLTSKHQPPSQQSRPSIRDIFYCYITGDNAVRHNILSSISSIIICIFVVVLCLIVGLRSDPIGYLNFLFIFICAFIGSSLTLFQNACFKDELTSMDKKKRDIRFSIALGISMIVFGVIIFVIGFRILVLRLQLSSQLQIVPSVVVFLGIICFGLFWYKSILATATRSELLKVDSRCLLCCSLTCFILTFTSLLHQKLWWFEGVMQMAVSLYTLYRGCESVWEASVTTNYQPVQTSDDYERQGNFNFNKNLPTKELELNPFQSGSQFSI